MPLARSAAPPRSRSQNHRAKAMTFVTHTAPPANSSSLGVSKEALSTMPTTSITAA